MRIRSFHIEEFGVLRHLDVLSMPDGMAIFLGENEAGKSTTLEFFRTMLTGFPGNRLTEDKALLRQFGPRQGGTLFLEDEHYGRIRLVRSLGTNNGAPALFDEQDVSLSTAVLDSMLGGVTREVFRQVYGFSLGELQNFETLNSEGVRNALYGASFGAGLLSPMEAMQKLQAEMDELFKPNAKKPRLNELFRQAEELRKALQEVNARSARFDALALEQETGKKALEALREEKTRLEEAVHMLERRLGVWQQWEEWKLCDARLQYLEKDGPINPHFPQDGVARLTRLEEKLEENRALKEQVRAKRFNLLQQIDTLKIDVELLPHRHFLDALSERKTSCLNALNALPSRQAGLSRAREQLERLLSLLGPDWDMPRIHKLDRSIFVREELERFAADIQHARNAELSAQSALDRATRETAHARENARVAESTLAALPEAPAELDAPARDALRKELQHWEESVKLLPERQKTYNATAQEYSRTLSHLSLRPPLMENRQESLPSISGMPSGMGAAVQALSDAQQEALALAEELAGQNAQAEAARRDLQIARKEEEAMALRLARTQKEATLARSGPGHTNSLENRRLALRGLRQNLAALEAEHARLADVTEHYTAQKALFPAPRWKKLYLLLGCVLLLVGAPLLFAYFFHTMGQVDPRVITEFLPFIQLEKLLPFVNAEGFIPLPLWFSSALTFLGIVLVLSSVPHASPDYKRGMVQLGHLRARKEETEKNKQELEKEQATLCAQLGITGAGLSPSADAEARPMQLAASAMLRATPATLASLDALEMDLEKERDQNIAGERLEAEVRSLQDELAECHKNTAAVEAVCNRAESAIKHTRSRWQDFFHRLHVGTVPAPEGAAAYFARVDAARLAGETCTHLQEEMQNLQKAGQELCLMAKQFLPAHLLAENPAESLTPESCALVVRKALEACRNAELLAEERVRAQESLRLAQESLVYAENNVQANQLALAEARASVEAKDTEWQTYIKTMGFGLNLSPSTTREALDTMERCLNAEAEVARLEGECVALTKEKETLTNPLEELVKTLGRQPHKGLDSAPDWLATLDILRNEAEKSRQAQEEHTHLIARKTELDLEEDRLKHEEENTARALEALLAEGKCFSAEEFRRVSLLFTEKEELVRRKTDLETTLSMALASPVFASVYPSLTAFLKSFEPLEQKELEESLAHNRQALVQSREEEEKQQAALAGRSAVLESLQSSEEGVKLRQNLAAAEEEIASLATEWARLALAKRLLHEARQCFEKNRQPEVVRLAAQLFSTISGGAWTNITASLENGSLMVMPPHGEPVLPEYLSRGAQEQLYLSLRLAHIQSHAGRATPLPLIMDDILVNFDPQRTERAIQALADVISPKEEGVRGHQILFFTCHPHIADILHTKIPGSTLYHQTRSGIQQA